MESFDIDNRQRVNNENRKKIHLFVKKNITEQNRKTKLKQGVVCFCFATNGLQIMICRISYSGSGESGEDDDGLEVVHIDENYFYMEHVIKIAAALHSIVSLAILIGYYHLKVSTFFNIILSSFFFLFPTFIPLSPLSVVPTC
jgi:hypothetical protein